MRNTFEYVVGSELHDEAMLRARKQEAVYGHNTGHFTLEVEKENTTVGVIGELVVREVLTEILQQSIKNVEVTLAPLGHPTDIQVRNAGSLTSIHVKTGMWRSWPRSDFSFGIHADQKIQYSEAPLILVSLLRSHEQLPKKARIEGFVTPEFLQSCPVIQRGELFPVTNVRSRTTNLLTQISDYRSLFELLEQKISE
jgi:hypothetical protein